MLENRKSIWDAECTLKDAYLVTASALANVDSSAKIFDTGGGFTEGVLDLYASAVSAASATAHYVVSLQGSASSTFATPTVELATIELGNLSAVKGSRAVGTGSYKLRWSNMFGSTVYRYLRIYTTVTGTVTTGINYTAQLTK